MKSFSPGFQLELDIFINDQSGFEVFLSLSERVREQVTSARRTSVESGFYSHLRLGIDAVKKSEVADNSCCPA
jgi:hypothetical protein